MIEDMLKLTVDVVFPKKSINDEGEVYMSVVID